MIKGPCRTGYFFIRAENAHEQLTGTCWKNPCGRQELYLPEHHRCYTIHSQGYNQHGLKCVCLFFYRPYRKSMGHHRPCPEGQLVLADDQHGIGYRGHCGCSTSNLQHYWPLDGKCYAHETRGPCRNTMVFSVRLGGGLTPSCICPSGQVYFNATRLCYKPYSQGPCAWNEWLAPSQSDVNDVRSARAGRGLKDEDYVCQCKPGYAYQSGSTFCQPPSLELLFSLPTQPSASVQRERRRTVRPRRRE